jgi:hypothetical protein
MQRSETFKGDFFNETGKIGGNPFWNDLPKYRGNYSPANLNVRWLSGATEDISNDQLNIAKCRLQLFDLVISDDLIEYAVKKVLCPLNKWTSTGGKRILSCDDKVSGKNPSPKLDPLNGTEPLLIGVLLERLRPSFELYDYARIMSWTQLKERGVERLPHLSDVPSYVEALAAYKHTSASDLNLQKIIKQFYSKNKMKDPPVEFCNKMKEIWTSNPDGELQKRCL